MEHHSLRPGGLVDGIVFFAGVFLGIIGLLAPQFQGLSIHSRSTHLSAWSFVLLIACVMPVVFEGCQRRYDSEGLLSARRPALLGSFVSGVLAGVSYYAIARSVGSMGWLLFPAVCILPWCASRALWRRGPD